jgi:WD40 repeat protein
MHLLETISGNEAITSFSGLSDSPILSFVSILQGRYILMTNMSGHLLLQRGSEALQDRKDHAKYAVKVIAQEELDDMGSVKALWVATAGWDATVYLYRLSIEIGDQTRTPVIGDPVARIRLTTNPESLLFVRHVDTGELLLLVSRRDSSYIYYYQVETGLQNGTPRTESHNADISPPECRLLGQQNLAPHSNAWVAFSPSHMALSPLDPGLLAVATSSEPHMKVIIVRLLFPSATSSNGSIPSIQDAPVTQASQALEALALQNREDAAILIQANTFAPQTSYSTPQVAWRPDGSGVWVNGDDGVVRGIELKTGKVIALLKDGHEPGSKVRTIWAGYVAVPNQGDDVNEEWVISGGFDKRLIVWKV